MSQVVLDANNIATVAGNAIVYSYDSATLEYLSSSTEYLAIGVGLPANSCIDAPPKRKEGFAICREDDLVSWTYIVDHRGETVYNIENQEAVIITVLGDYPVKTTEIAPESPYDKWSGDAWVKDDNAEKEAAVAQAERKKISLLSKLNSDILPFQDAVDLGIASDDELATLNALKKYRVQLNRVDTSLAPDIQWPVMPENEAN